MVSLADIARINGSNPTKRYIPITLSQMNKGSASYLVRRIRGGIDEGVTRFQIRVARDVPCYPNYITPIAGVIEYFKCLGITFLPSKSLVEHEYISQIGLLNPSCDPNEISDAGFVNRIWVFTPDTHYQIVSGIMKDIYTGLEVERGVLHSIELCLNEITDNVLNHSLGFGGSRDPHGFLMAQVHGNSKRIAISVFDTGIGIYRSLKYAIPSIHEPKEAIELAVRKGVTSGNGRGNGLWILQSIVVANGGSLEITSSGARYSLISGKRGSDTTISFSKASSGVSGTTLVDFQLDIHTPMDIASILDYQPVDLWLESHEDDSNEDDAVIKLSDESRGFGTRIAARQMRTMIGNLSKEFHGRIVLDFDSVDMMSTSYADELVAKLLKDRELNSRLVIRNVNEACRLAIGEVCRDEGVE